MNVKEYLCQFTIASCSFRSLRSGAKSGALPRTLVFLLLAVSLLALGTFKEVNIHRLLLPFLQHPIQAPLCSLSHPLPLSISSLLSISQPPSYPRLVTTRSGTPFLRKTRSSTGIAARLKGQFRNFHSMASRSSLFSPRDRGRAGTDLIPAFQLRKAFIVDRNYLRNPCCLLFVITITVLIRAQNTMETAI